MLVSRFYCLTMYYGTLSHIYIYIYYSKGGNVIFFFFYKRWIKWILFLLVMIEFTSFRRQFLSLLSNSNKIWPLWNPGNLKSLLKYQVKHIPRDVFKLKFFCILLRCLRKRLHYLWENVLYLGNCVQTLAYYFVEWMLIKLTRDHLRRTRQVPLPLACFSEQCEYYTFLSKLL